MVSFIEIIMKVEWFITHSIHVWHICSHWGYIHGKCYQLLSYIAYMDPMGNVLYHQFHEKKHLQPLFHRSTLPPSSWHATSAANAARRRA